MNRFGNTPPLDPNAVDKTMIDSIMRELDENNNAEAALTILKKYRKNPVSPETYLELLKQVLIVQSREKHCSESRSEETEPEEYPRDKGFKQGENAIRRG
jgi:hypothetical protein